MAVLLHGLVAQATPCPPGAGPHLRLPVGPFDALCSDLGPDLDGLNSPEETARTALAHNDILMLYAARGDVLPVRFGTVFSAADAVVRYLEAEEGRFARAMQAIRGADEFVLRLMPGTAAAMREPEARDGRSYLRQRKAARDRAQVGAAEQGRVMAGLEQAILPLARARRMIRPGSRGALCDILLLVERGHQAALADFVTLWAVELGQCGVVISCSGPWPPYSFAAEERADG